MALYGAAELADFTSSGAATENTTSGHYSSTYGIRQAIRAGATSADYYTTGSGLGSFSTFWHRFTVYMQNTGQSGATLAQYHNSSGTAVFRLQFTSNTVLQAQYWNGSAWTNIGSTYTVANTTLLTFDLNIVCGGSGSYALYVGGSTIAGMSGSASMTSVTNIDEFRHYGTNTSVGNTAETSEHIWGDESTIGHRFCIAPPTGNGTYTAGSGAFGDVDDAATNDADFSTLTNNGDAETYTHSAMTLPAGTVKAVMVNGRVKNAAGGALNVKARLRIGSTDYDQGSNYSGISTAYGAYRARWATNPAGGSWTQTTASQTSNEFGYLAQT